MTGAGIPSTESAQKLDLFLSCAPVAVIEWTPGLEVIEWNPGAERIFGYTRDESVGRRMAEVIVPGTAKAAVEEVFRQLLNATGGTYSKNENITKHGAVICCEWHNAAIQNEQGEVTSLLSLGLDVTELQRALHEEKRSLERFELVALGSRDGFFDYHASDPSSPIDLNAPVYFSQSLFEMFGYCEADLPKTVEAWTRIVHPDDIAFVFDTFRGHIRRKKERASVEHRCVKKSGEVVWVHDIWQAVYDRAGRLTRLAGTLRDITERKRAERALLDQLAVIQEQRDTIQALSSPIIEVWEGVLCLPVVRLLDRERASEMMQSLLAAIVRNSARFAILDLTGVGTVDTLTASHFLELSAAARLLGAETILTGLRPAVAQTLVSLQIDLSAIVTLPNLKEALKMCMRRLAADS
jgi:rsbT co-antagonist protein RsbR